MSLSGKTCGFFALVVVCFLSRNAVAATPAADSVKNPALGTLPPLTGPFAVGKMTARWTDESRVEPLSPNHEPRELMVDIWYPAESSNAVSADYLDGGTYEKALGSDGFRNFFREASETLRKGVKTHAFAAAPYARSTQQSPVLIFSPGGGMVREVYAAQLEDLASHGYVVAAITHPYDGIVSVFPDGHWITYDPKRWPQIPSFEGEWNLNQLKWHARDVRFVLDELERVNRGPNAALPFAGHLNLQ